MSWNFKGRHAVMTSPSSPPFHTTLVLARLFVSQWNVMPKADGGTPRNQQDPITSLPPPPKKKKTIIFTALFEFIPAKKIFPFSRSKGK